MRGIVPTERSAPNCKPPLSLGLSHLRADPDGGTVPFGGCISRPIEEFNEVMSLKLLTGEGNGQMDQDHQEVKRESLWTELTIIYADL